MHLSTSASLEPRRDVSDEEDDEAESRVGEPTRVWGF